MRSSGESGGMVDAETAEDYIQSTGFPEFGTRRGYDNPITGAFLTEDEPSEGTEIPYPDVDEVASWVVEEAAVMTAGGEEDALYKAAEVAGYATMQRLSEAGLEPEDYANYFDTVFDEVAERIDAGTVSDAMNTISADVDRDSVESLVSSARNRKDSVRNHMMAGVQNNARSIGLASEGFGGLPYDHSDLERISEEVGKSKQTVKAYLEDAARGKVYTDDELGQEIYSAYKQAHLEDPDSSTETELESEDPKELPSPDNFEQDDDSKEQEEESGESVETEDVPVVELPESGDQGRTEESEEYSELGLFAAVAEELGVSLGYVEECIDADTDYSDDAVYDALEDVMDERGLDYDDLEGAGLSEVVEQLEGRGDSELDGEALEAEEDDDSATIEIIDESEGPDLPSSVIPEDMRDEKEDEDGDEYTKDDFYQEIAERAGVQKEEAENLLTGEGDFNFEQGTKEAIREAEKEFLDAYRPSNEELAQEIIELGMDVHSPQTEGEKSLAQKVRDRKYDKNELGSLNPEDVIAFRIMQLDDQRPDVLTEGPLDEQHRDMYGLESMLEKAIDEGDLDIRSVDQAFQELNQQDPQKKI